MREQTSTFFKRLQDQICAALEELDGGQKFICDFWTRSADGAALDGGGGETRVLENGKVFEKAGVNFSQVHGELSFEMSERLVAAQEKKPFFATGISLVLHPYSPMVPTVHANFRYLEVADESWFGGGTDLTPYYPYEEDITHFHCELKSACDKHDPTYYPRYKKWCDEYFYLPHRRETRGVGGLFFDYVGRDNPSSHPKNFLFVKDLGNAFLHAYLPIVERRCAEPFSQREKEFQLLRRGRYVEFNLLYDRGTHFGLKTGGRVESILMSLPPTVYWSYNPQVKPGSREAKLFELLTHPREWV